MTRTFFSTANAGSGGRFDIRNNAGAVIDVIGNYYSTVSGNAPIIGAAGTAGDPWITNLPGAYGAGTAGNIVGNLEHELSITVTPLQANAANPRYSTNSMANIAAGSSNQDQLTVLDGQKNPVNLSVKTVRLVFAFDHESWR